MVWRRGDACIVGDFYVNAARVSTSNPYRWDSDSQLKKNVGVGEEGGRGRIKRG